MNPHSRVSQAPLEPSASTLLTPARTLQVGLHPPHSRPCRPPLSPPQSRLALAQDLDTSSHALRPTGTQPGLLPFILPGHACVGSC